MLEVIKRNPLIRSLYRIPGLISGYHFLWALAGAVFYRFPSERMKVVGVTGTKGKTTVVELVAALLEAAGHKTAVLSSITVKTGADEAKNRTGNSMPGRGYIQKFLRRARQTGCSHAVIEVTSEGARRHRHRFIRWAAAAITNIAPEHIESHGSFENYRDAKLLFLKYAAEQGAPVFVNAEDGRSTYFLEQLGELAAPYLTENIPAELSHIWEVLPGRFSRENVAAAVAVARALGIGEEAIRSGLENFKGVSGRVDFVQREPFKVVVDYAHTPESLEAIFGTLREMTPGRLICVFGATGGGRDKWKRPAMGEKAAVYCDEIILTDDDPYEEDSLSIIAEIRKGIGDLKPTTEIVDRKEAIHEAIRRAAPGDAVVMTGKGTEPFLHLAGGKKIEWNDKEVAEEALAKRVADSV